MSLNTKYHQRCFASLLSINLKNPLKTKLATDSPGWTQELIMMHFRFLRGYFLFGSAVIVTKGVGSPSTESIKFDHS